VSTFLNHRCARPPKIDGSVPRVAAERRRNMPSPQSLTPQPLSPSRPLRRFTLEQANRTLPLVKRIVADIVRTHGEISQCQTRLETAKAAEHAAVQARLSNGLEHLQDYVDELTEIGCELKDFRLGLIDFIGRHDGRDVCLCWKLGEDRIFFWHDLKAGYAGRQPVATLRENT
jgi:hypothetical protein